MRVFKRIAQWIRLQYGMGPAFAIAGIVLAIQGMREMSTGQQ